MDRPGKRLSAGDSGDRRHLPADFCPGPGPQLFSDHLRSHLSGPRGTAEAAPGDGHGQWFEYPAGVRAGLRLRAPAPDGVPGYRPGHGDFFFCRDRPDLFPFDGAVLAAGPASSFSPDWSFVRVLFYRSWPAALLQLAWNAGSVVLYNFLGRMGAGSIPALAAFSNGLRLEAIIYLPAFALHMAASVMVGQNLGAGLVDSGCPAGLGRWPESGPWF